MEELKALVEAVASLPEFAIYLVIGYFIYKAFIVGSIYGIIRLAINQIHDYLVKPKQVQMMLGVTPINEQAAARLRTALLQLQDSQYLHESDIAHLEAVLALFRRYPKAMESQQLHEVVKKLEDSIAPSFTTKL